MKYKYAIAQFTFYDRTGIKRILEEKAKRGWLLDRMGSLTWRFRRIDPKPIHYTVTYFPKASVFDPEPTEQQRTFMEFCEHTGWHLAASNGPLQIFYNELEEPVPIETDPMTEIRTIHGSAKKNFLPSFFMLLLLAVMQLCIQVGQIVSFPLTYLSQNSTLFNWLSITILLIMCAQEIGGYFLWYRKALKAARFGEFVQTKSHRNFQLGLLGIDLIALGLLLCTMERRFAAVMGISILSMLGLMMLIFGIKALLKRWKTPRSTARTVTYVAVVILSLVLTVGVSYGLMDLVQSDFWDTEVPESYEVQGHRFSVYHDELPLYVEDLTQTDYGRYSTELHESRSLLISRVEGRQNARVLEDAPELNYVIYEIHVPILYDVCFQELLFWYDDWLSVDEEGNVVSDRYLPEEASSWGAEEAYRLHSVADAYNWYLLCYEDRLITIQFDWEPTEDQRQTVGEILGK